MKKKILEIIIQHKFEHISSEQAISEILDLFAVSDSAIDVILWLADCPYSIDQATVPKDGIDAAPRQVVGNMSLGYVKYKQLRDVAEHYCGNVKEE
ncbi:MAG: hypothetical protein ACOC22_04470 [bacterium]